MKTTAFLIRVAICLLLSMIPLTELENRIYSVRMEVRNRLKFAKPTGIFKSNFDSSVVIVEVSSSDLGSSEAMTLIQNEISSQKPALILIARTDDWKRLLTDPDGIVRRTGLMHEGQPSLALLAHTRLHSDLESTQPQDVSHLINYRDPRGSIPQCIYSRQFRSVCPSVRDKIVLLSENTDNYPRFHTPVGAMSPSEVLANDILTVIDHEQIYEAPMIVRILITFIMILIAAFYIIYYPVLISALAITSTGVLVIALFFQFNFQMFNFYIPSGSIFCSLLITYLVFTGYRLALQENLQWRSLKQAQYLRELDQMKTNFLSLVSHDLKTPLAKIQAVAERLRRELALPMDQRSDWRELIDSIENSNNEMKRFISSILNLSKIESQKVILNKKSNDINSLIEAALKRLLPLAQQKHIQIEKSLEPLFSIECDEDLMQQVLTNLIDNAIKYSPPQSKILVRSQEEEGFVRVEVEDFGPGIPRDQLPFMFRKFSRFLRPIKEEVKGTGLGLYLSKYFIELHGGTIRVKSVEGHGTIFSFTLPLQNAESDTILS